MFSQWNIQNSSLASGNEWPVSTEKTNSKSNCLEQKTNRKYFKSPKLQMQINRLWNHMLGNAPVKGKEEETKFEAWRIRCLRLLPALACRPAEHSAPGLIRWTLHGSWGTTWPDLVSYSVKWMQHSSVWSPKMRIQFSWKKDGLAEKDREAWHAEVHGIAKSRHDWATEQQTALKQGTERGRGRLDRNAETGTSHTNHKRTHPHKHVISDRKRCWHQQ